MAAKQKTLIQSIEWTSDLDVGIEEINDEHKHLIGLANQVLGACYVGQGGAIIADVVDQLIDYTRYHFDREIDILEKYDYPDLAMHRREHDDLIKRVLQIKARIDDEKADEISLETMLFLQDWLINHVMEHDRDYGAFLRQRGVSSLSS